LAGPRRGEPSRGPRAAARPARAPAKTQARKKASATPKAVPKTRAGDAEPPRSPRASTTSGTEPARFDAAAALGTAAHELKNGLGPLAMTLQLIERKALAGEAVPPQDLAFARAQVRRLSRLVSDLLDVTHVDTEQLPIRARPGDLTALVEEAIDAFERGNVRQVARALPAGPVMAAFDPERLLQVLLNLLENAAKYAPLPAPITVALARRGADARVEVRDGGPGLSAEDQHRVFDRFTRARDPEDETRGLGLGLYLCRAIVERHGGRMGVDSAPGRGATFWFELPV
jgi:signal transduction histidine kinase